MEITSCVRDTSFVNRLCAHFKGNTQFVVLNCMNKLTDVYYWQRRITTSVNSLQSANKLVTDVCIYLKISNKHPCSNKRPFPHLNSINGHFAIFLNKIPASNKRTIGKQLGKTILPSGVCL